MRKEMEKKLLALKGYSFDGDTGRTLKDLYKAVNDIGGQKDAPFVSSLSIKGRSAPAAINSYLDPGGERFQIVWQSESSGISHVTEIRFNVPSLAKIKNEDSCGSCNAGMSDLLESIYKDS